MHCINIFARTPAQTGVRVCCKTEKTQEGREDGKNNAHDAAVFCD